MLESMKNLILFNLIIPALLISFSSSAGLYKGLDEEGNVVYSDVPFDNAKKFTAPPITIVNPPKALPKEEVTEKEEEIVDTKYSKFSIVSPTNDETIWNAPQLTVSLQIKPALNTNQGHTTWLLMDGKPMVKNSQSLALQIGRSDRGSHTLKAQIRNKKGKILKSTRTITIHIKNSVVPRPSLTAR